MTLDEAFNYIGRVAFNDHDAALAMRAFVANRGCRSLSQLKQDDPDAVIAFADALKAMTEQLNGL